MRKWEPRSMDHKLAHCCTQTDVTYCHRGWKLSLITRTALRRGTMQGGATYSSALTQKHGTYYNHQEHHGSCWLCLKPVARRANHISERRRGGGCASTERMSTELCIGSPTQNVLGRIRFCIAGVGTKVAECRNYSCAVTVLFRTPHM